MEPTIGDAVQAKAEGGFHEGGTEPKAGDILQDEYDHEGDENPFEGPWLWAEGGTGIPHVAAAVNTHAWEEGS